MSRTPIDVLFDQASFKCTKCGAKMGTCGCWVKCRCGWSYEAGVAAAIRALIPEDVK